MATVRESLGAISGLGAILLAGACHRSAKDVSPRSVVRFVSSPSADSPFAEQLAGEYARLIPTLDIQVVHAPSLASLGNGDGDIAAMGADMAYATYTSDAKEGAPSGSGLRAIATLQVAPLQVLVWQNGGIRKVSDLRGRSVGVTLGDSLADMVLKAFHLDQNVIRKGPFLRSRLAVTFVKGDVDAAFINGLYPVTSVQEAIRDGARLLSLDGPELDQLLFEYPFVQLISIPPGAYIGQVERVRTIGVDVVLVCRKNLEEKLVHELTEHLVSAMSRIPAYHPALRLIEVDEASTTPIPLHEGAARYYREWALFR